ncbi:MAG: sugar ABC transporter substrate-binding protein, partial [Halanaerobiales bacterium]
SINNFEEQVRLLSEVEEDAVDGIIISPLDLKGIREVVNRRKFNPEKTPIVTLNMDLEHSRRLFYVGPDYRKSGKLAAEVMIKLISYQGKVAFLTSDYRTESIVEREKGFQDKISCYPELKLIKVTVHDLAELPQITRALLEKHPDLKGMVSSLPVHNDYRQALQELKENKLRVVAFDLTRETRDCIKDDLIQAAILQRPFYQGYYVIRMLFNYLVNGFRPEQERNCIALDIAMSENVDLIEDIEEGKYL